MLTRTVDAGKGLLVQQYAETMLAGHLLHQRHQHHVMIHGEVGLLEDRSQLKLVRCHLVMTGLTRNAQLQCLNLQIAHKGCHTLRNSSEIVVVHLLVLGRVVSHQCSSCQQQIGTGSIESFIHQEILLFPTQVGSHLLHAGVEVMTHIRCCYVHSMERTFQRCFIVERLTAI